MAGQRRPKSAAKLAAEKKKREEAARIDALISELPELYKCTKCGKITQNPMGVFYSVGTNEIFEHNDNRTNICMSCANQLFEDYTKEYKDRKVALMLVCMQMGCYFSEPLYDMMDQSEEDDPEKNEFTLSKYMRSLNINQYKKKPFLNYMMELLKSKSGLKTASETRDEREEKWKKSDKLNKSQCLSVVGYDPFDDESYTSEDRRHLFGGLSRYLMISDIAEDKHKMDSAIEIVKSTHQLSLVDIETNKELKSPSPDFGKMKQLSDTKTALNRIINQLAKENGISMSGSGKRSQNAMALTSIMKEMIDNGVVEAKTNLTTVKMSETFQNIAAINAKALMEELGFTGDEYAEMVSQQADTIRSLNKQVDTLKEELRLMTIRAHEAEKPQNQRKVVYTVDVNTGENIEAASGAPDGESA
jgi:hypothetical protein